MCVMSEQILDCLKRKRDICIKNIIPSQNTAFRWTPALNARFKNLEVSRNEVARSRFFSMLDVQSWHEFGEIINNLFFDWTPDRVVLEPSQRKIEGVVMWETALHKAGAP